MDDDTKLEVLRANEALNCIDDTLGCIAASLVWIALMLTGLLVTAIVAVCL